MTQNQVENTKQPQSECLCAAVNYLNFTHPPKTGCQNLCRNGFFTEREREREKEPGGIKREEGKKEAERHRGRGRRRAEERVKGSGAAPARGRTLAARRSAP